MESSSPTMNPGALNHLHLVNPERSENETFESHVLAEEWEKERTLSRIKSYAKERAEAGEYASDQLTRSCSSTPSPSSSASPARGPFLVSSYLNAFGTAAGNSSSICDSTIKNSVIASGDSSEEDESCGYPGEVIYNHNHNQISLTGDVRAELFEAIPDYPHETNFQRVIITQLDDSVDPDTHLACKSLLQCMNLRDKWLLDQPSPPQDILPSSKLAFDETGTAGNSELTLAFANMIMSPKRRTSSFEKLEFRRRLPPDYAVFNRTIPVVCCEYSYSMVKGVMAVYKRTPTSTEVKGIDGASTSIISPQVNAFPVYSFEEFVKDFNTVRQAVYGGPTSSFSYRQLELLASKFQLHCLLNGSRELDAQKSVPHRDFYNVRKVDTHVHHSACMNQKHLLRFIKHKLRHVPNEVVVFRDGKFLTLGEVFKSLRLTAYDLSIDTLDMHANDTFHRFDRFNLKYNPAGQSRLREIFLKTDNFLGGRYLAEITKEVMSDLEAAKYQLVEWRVSIYGRKASEWESLAKWFYANRLAHMNVRWLIQIPRLFHIYRQGGELRSFEQMLNNIFAPLFAVTLDPSSNPALHYFLETVVGIDSVDDESRPEHGQLSYGIGGIPSPEDWTTPNNPPYGYWMYYMYANLCALNKLRASLNMCTFQFRPHCGEAGDVDHLVSTFLLANQINHGIQLRKNASLQYLYYLAQVGIAMSPLSNNKLFLDYAKNPFLKYFYIGMNVSLSTDDPLMLHYTKDPLVEEYSVAAQVWKLNSADLCEIARNSVLQSGWEMEYKQYFLGKDLSDIKETNVPDIRLRYRMETLDAEIEAIRKNALKK